MNSRLLHRLATHPHELVRALQTGRLPRGERPASPLIDVLSELSPRDLQAIKGLTIDERLGYAGRRVFATGAQAFRWLKPADEVFGSYPAGSWQNKRFARRLTLSEVVACATSSPEGLESRYPRLR